MCDRNAANFINDAVSKLAQAVEELGQLPEAESLPLILRLSTISEELKRMVLPAPAPRLYAPGKPLSDDERGQLDAFARRIRKAIP